MKCLKSKRLICVLNIFIYIFIASTTVDLKCVFCIFDLFLLCHDFKKNAVRFAKWLLTNRWGCFECSILWFIGAVYRCWLHLCNQDSAHHQRNEYNWFVDIYRHHRCQSVFFSLSSPSKINNNQKPKQLESELANFHSNFLFKSKSTTK